ncbi:putative symporter YagG [mine drainage metagenome]|uniref:Putative symporter YagG n=1 Tax=mine drainage metagenome TaxID=410659 RepID=A0A1J5PMH3_9ZZZZ
MFGVVAMLGVIGAVIVLLFPILAGRFGRTGAQSVQDMGWFIFWLTPITIVICALRTPERITRDHGAEQFRFRDYLSLLIKPDLLRLFLGQMALTLGPGWMSALYVFFFTDSRGYSLGVASLLLLLYVLAGVAGAPLTAKLAQRLGKHRALMVTTTAYSIGLCMVMVVPKGNVILALPVMFWCGFMAAGFDLMIRAMLADVADEVRLEQGKERLSLIYALNTLAAKIALAFSIGLTFPLIGKLGYVAEEGYRNTPQAIHVLEIAYIVGPILFVMLGGVCVMGWRLTEARHAEIRRQLDAQDGAPRVEYEEAPIIDSLGGSQITAIVDDARAGPA